MAINNPEIDTTVALIQKDLDNFSQLFDKLDVTVEKISEANNNISKLLSLHEQRLENLYQNDKLLETKLEKNAGSFSEEVKQLHYHIRDNNKDVTDKLKMTEESIKNDIKYTRELIDRENKTLKDLMESENKELNNSIESANKRIVALERWRWLVGGGLLVVIWFLNKSPIAFSILT